MVCHVFESLADFCFFEDTARRNKHGLDAGPFLPELFRIGNHRCDSHASNIRMVNARCQVEDNFAVVEHGRNDCEVRQMGAASFGVVGEKGIAWFELAFPEFVLVLNCELH